MSDEQPVAWAALSDNGDVAWIGYTADGAADGAGDRRIVPLYAHMSRSVHTDENHVDNGKTVPGRDKGDAEVARLRLEAAHVEIDRLRAAIRALANQDATLSVVSGDVRIDMDQRWIPVSERLPPLLIEVLGWHIKDRVRAWFRHSGTVQGGPREGVYWEQWSPQDRECDDCRVDEPSHWMPLPSPPEADDA